MDILFVRSEEKARLIPLSIHGILWLQTHFEEKEWEALISNKVVLSTPNAKILSEDAHKAGIKVSELSPVSVAA